MSLYLKFALAAWLLLGVQSVSAQHTITGRILDNVTSEPIAGASIQIEQQPIVKTLEDGSFFIHSKSIATSVHISNVGYETQVLVLAASKNQKIFLNPKTESLQTIVVTANREASLRTQTPVAISKLSATLINDTKPTLLTELINKTPGVVMLNYNNEQHGMGIRQPFGTSAYFLYLEDGLPIRPLGVFNHNALIEINTLSINSVEVIKGPASSLYGAEAVGGAINFITQKPTAVPTAKVGIQLDNFGYKRVQWGAGAYVTKKLGVFTGGYVANQVDSWQIRSDYRKFSVNARADYQLTTKSAITTSISVSDYYSQTGGSTDSTAFYKRQYTSNNDFTYRSVNAIRASLKLQHNWNDSGNSAITVYYRKNAIGQNPSYSLRWTPPAKTATGEINENSFNSLGLTAQHSQNFRFLNSRLLAGLSADRSPNGNWAYKTELEAVLRPDQKSVEKFNLLKKLPDVFLVNYDAIIYNVATFSQVDMQPVPRLRVSVGARYDRMDFSYTNHVDQTSGTKQYGQFTPKLGVTFDLKHSKGLYANYSKGFSPPALSAIFRKRANVAPGEDIFYYNLKSATFNNFEVGGWASLFANKLYIDWAVYRMAGKNELLNIRQPDGSTDYQSAGKTLHKGVEYALTYKPNKQFSIRFGGTNAIHRFVEFSLSNRSTDALKNVNGYDMPQAPKWVSNTEIMYKPMFAKGLRLGAEWQAISSWYQNQLNTIKYNDRGAFGFEGISVLNFRAGYQWRNIELFANVLNATNELYASSATRGNNITDRSTYTPAAPRTFITGIQYNLNGKR